MKEVEEMAVGIIDNLREMQTIICDEYCKYPETYHKKYKDDDEATDKMFCEKCRNCPMMRL